MARTLAEQGSPGLPQQGYEDEDVQAAAPSQRVGRALLSGDSFLPHPGPLVSSQRLVTRAGSIITVPACPHTTISAVWTS